MTSSASWGFVEGDPITAELTVVRRLGGGSAYEAYLAFDEHTYGPVVVKVVRPDRVEDDHSLRGLAREVDALATVNHPVVVRGLRHELGGARPHVVLEQVDGPRLSTLVRRYGRLPEHQYLPLAIELASALQYLRRIGWTHLDVKPSNVIMGAPARLIDLSVARPVEDAARTVRIGTDAYLAPEQWDPERYGAPGPASDVWGLGATLFEAVAGERAYETFDDQRSLPDRTPAEVSKVVYAALELDPANRPLPHEVAEALEPVLDRQPPARLGGGLRTR
ncbi:serine/threonine-protein kinase [Nocardioides caricicola]|uniref:non-specific serine/threonine protein kinase n=1 Tax=Nocardioides caricicola TaxID=634770 RepID=A0ABW0N9I0_9ACTN